MGWKGNTVSQQDLARALKENPLATTENIRVSLLNKTEQASVHLVQVRGNERAHVHQTHDMNVFVVCGFGDMVIGSETIRVREGDVVLVPAGVRHRFINRARSPSVAVVVFSPPFDGKDTVPAE